MIKVTLASGQAGDAAIMGQDPAADIAVIRAAGVSGATPAGSVQHLGCTVGDTVLAIGDLLDVAVRRWPAYGRRGDRPGQAW